MERTTERTMTDRDLGGADLRQFIAFSLDEEEFGIELLRVREVIRMHEITWLPRAPSFVKGIINLRGEVIPIVDLRGKLALPTRTADADTRIVVVEIETRLVGMVVDGTSQVVRLPADRIDPPPALLGKLPPEFVSGVGKLGDRLVTLVNVDRILSGDERVALHRMDLPGDGTARREPDAEAPGAPDAGQ